MFVIRSVLEKDLEDLYSLSKIVTFINLPPDKRIIQKKIKNSLQSFEKPNKDLSKNIYLFVIEDPSDNSVIGACLIHAQHGDKDEPHFFLKVGQEKKFSKTLNTGFIHGTLKLGFDCDGPTEIGGLVLDPEFRGHPDKLGKQLSFSRFLYMCFNSDHFKDEIHSELMPPLDTKGNSPLWEALGRRFMNMDYQSADILSRSNKEFILNLFPSETIYVTLLPIDARNAIGKVGNDTKPVKNMLEKIGFKYNHEVDPFDGGPHYRAKLKEISLFKTRMSGTIHTSGKFDVKKSVDVLIQINRPDFQFFSFKAKAQLFPSKDKNKGTITLDQKIIENFSLKDNEKFQLILLD